MDPIRNAEPQLRELERRGYWNWVATSLLLGGLCLCVVVLFVAQEAMSQLPDPGTGIIFVVGLCGSIALFSFYVLHKQRAIGRLRTRLFEAQIHEAQLLRARETAMETARLKSEVLSQISREIRTPMTGILGAVEILLEGELTPRQNQLLRTSKACAEALTGLLNDILDLSKIDPQKFELEKIPFNLRDCVATAIRPLTARARQKGLELACHVAVGVPDQLAGDPGRIRQLINILVGNAIKFTLRGEVVVRVEAESEMDRNVILRFSVTDTGPGIPTESQQAVFGNAVPADGSTLGGHPAKPGLAEPGTTGTVVRTPGAPTPADASAPRKPEVMGIGLALASQLLTMMGGHIGVESELGKGSTFWFTARFTLQTHPSMDRARRPSVDLKDRRVLVVDDNATNQWIFVEMVEGWGMQTVAVAGAEAAVEVLKQARLSGTAFDLALLDLSLPGAEGLAPAARIKAEPELAEVPLIVLTSAAQPGDARRCRDLGIAGYLPKPVMGSDLLGAMRAVLGGGATDGARLLVTRHWLRENRSQHRILVAQSDPALTTVLARALKQRGHHVVTVGDCTGALEAVAAEPFDLVLIDTEMPEAERFDLTAVIRARERTTGGLLPVVALAPSDRPKPSDLWAGRGVEAWVRKPVQVEDLLDTIDRVVSAHESPDANLAAAA